MREFPLTDEDRENRSDRPNLVQSHPDLKPYYAIGRGPRYWETRRSYDEHVAFMTSNGCTWDEHIDKKIFNYQFNAKQLRKAVCKDNGLPPPDETTFFIEYGNDGNRKVSSEGTNATANPSKRSRKKRKGSGRSTDDSQRDATTPTPSPKTREREYILDSGASYHCISEETLTDAERATITYAHKPVPFNTANGVSASQRLVRAYCKDLDRYLDFYVLDGSSPSLISMGLLCRYDNYIFHWEPSEAVSLLTAPEGKVIACDASEVNTPMLKPMTFRIIAPSTSHESDADSEGGSEDRAPEIDGDAIVPPPPLPVPTEAPPVSDTAPAVVTEYLRRDRRDEIYKAVPNSVQEIDAFFYDVNDNVIWQDLNRKRDPVHGLRYRT